MTHKKMNYWISKSCIWNEFPLHVNQMCLISFDPCIFLCGSLQQHCTLRKDVIIFTHAYNIQCDCWRVFLFAMHADTTPKFSERTKHSLVFRLLNWNNSDIHSLSTKVVFLLRVICVSPVEDNPLTFELSSNSLRLTCLLRSQSANWRQIKCLWKKYISV